MKKIIHGIRYDTDKAQLVGSHEMNLTRSDFSYWKADLYVTPKARRFFLVGEGGGMSRFAQRLDGGGSTYGRALIPVEAAEARAWAEQYLNTDTIEQHFADLIEDA